MKNLKLLICAAVFLLTGIGASGQITLEYCLQQALENYPLIKKYDLVRQTEVVSLSDINKGWLPRIGVFAQGTVQNAVSAFPDALRAMLDKTGASVAGMSRLQYKGGVEVNQTIWDGGHSMAQRAVERATTAQAEAALEVEIYAVNERVEGVFFGILLMEEQIARMNLTLELLESNLARMKSMVSGGLATQSDADMIEAQILTMKQQLIEAQSASDSYRRVLELYINEDIAGKSLVRPTAVVNVAPGSNRPELELFDRQIELNRERMKATDVSIMPRMGFFAQAYYGYPGFNIFESVMKRDPSFNALAGVKVSWNIDGFYTRNNSRKKLATASDITRTDRELFLFNNKLKSTQEQAKIAGLRKLMEEDARIVELRKNVRESAESQLAHGIIDVTALLTKITDENQAVLNRTLHEIQLLQTVYQLKNTLNR